MKHYKWLLSLVLCSASLLAVLSMSAGSASAHHVRRYHYHMGKMYFSKNKRHKSFKRLHHRHCYKYQLADLESVNDQGSGFLNSIRNNLFNDINRSRAKYHRKKLRPIIWLQRAANYRARHVQAAYEYTHRTHVHLGHHADAMWVHGYDSHTALANYISHIKPHWRRSNYYGENVCDYVAGRMQYQSDDTLAPYNNTTPRGIAANANNDLMYHDMSEGNDNGHRKNELNRHYHYLGVSVKYNPYENYGTMTEDFSA